MESNHHSQRHQGYSLESSPVLSVRVKEVADRIRTDASGITTPGASRYTTATMFYGSDRIRTGTLSPDKRALSSLSYAPSCAGGI
jgi:hypothetical protein